MDVKAQQADLDDVRQVLAGNVEAFEGIVRRWQGPLVNMAYRFCRNRGQAEEWAQEAFLRAYRFLDRWRQDAAFSTWLFTVAANVYRSRTRRARPPEVPLAADRPGPGVVNPVDTAEAGERDEIVRRTVCTLPGKYREAILLFYFHEMDLAAVAASLNLPAGTVKARLHRGRAMLRDRLGRVLGTGGVTEAR
jgi:RNA polymerase sigma-70 factor (ECF subfamily)